MATQPTTKTAMSKEPKAAPQNLTRVSPGVYRDSKGNLVTKSGTTLRSGSRGGSSSGGETRTPSQRRSEMKDIKKESDYRKARQPRQVREGEIEAGYFGQRALDLASKFNPNNPWANVPQQGFTDQMNAARQSVMAEFERTNAPEFARQNAAFQQQMMEQGIDPNSEAYQAQFRALTESQNQARQAAESQAFQLGAGYQQQGYEQFMQGQMLPFQQYAATEKMWTLPYQVRAEAEQAEKNRQAQLQAQRMGAGASVQAAQIQAQAQRDAMAMQMANQYQQGQQQVPWYNSAIGGFAQGFGAGVGAGIAK